ncbi:MAG: hypothetical protein ACR2JN_01200 [Lapillicoccus sp.]
MPARLPAEVAAQARSTGLGGYLGSLKPDRSASLRTLAVGAVFVVAALAILAGSADPGWPVQAGAALGGLAGLGMFCFGLIELLPSSGQLYLFEDGFVHQLRDGQTDAMRYGASERGEQLRQKAAAMRAAGVDED